MVKLYPGVAQLVARMVRVHEAVGSTPATRTSKKCCNLSDYSTFPFFRVHTKVHTSDFSFQVRTSYLCPHS